MTVGSGDFYVSKDGDVLDRIVGQHYGDTSPEILRAVLEENPGLAAKGPVLAGGLRIWLPVIDRVQPLETAQLWG